MARGSGKKGGSGWTNLSKGKKPARSIFDPKPSKGQDSRKVHDTKGKNTHGRTGGKPKQR